MNYLFLVYQSEAASAELPGSQQQIIAEAGPLYEAEIRQQGYLLAAENFQESQTVLSLQMMAGEIVFGEGETADSNHRLVQLYLIRARDLNEAILVGSKMPQLRCGSVEIRPLLEIQWPL